MSNYYVKETIGGEIVKAPIEEDNVFTTCPRCGAEFAVDLADIVDTMGGTTILNGEEFSCPNTRTGTRYNLTLQKTNQSEKKE